MLNKIEIIAEVKTKSPFGFQSEKSWDELFEIAEEIGDKISVHTDLRWGGSFDLLSKARKKTKKPILAKGIHSKDSDILKALENGADQILVVGRIPEILTDKCLIEPNSIEELKKYPSDLKAVWNSRDLNSGHLKTQTFSEARKVWKGWLCQASNIKSVADVEMDADAILIGTNIEAFSKSLRKKYGNFTGL